jgi:hypothetical protein
VLTCLVLCCAAQAEEDEKDRQQAGGRNPMVSDDMVRFNFTTGRLPRRLKTSGDVNFAPDEVVGEFLKVRHCCINCIDLSY